MAETEKIDKEDVKTASPGAGRLH